MDSITVYGPDGGGLLVPEPVAKALALRNGQRLSEAEAWEALGASARHLIRHCKAEIAKIEAETPDHG